MAVGLGPLPTLHPVPGFELGIASAGIKRPGRKDVVVMRCAEGSSVAGVFTLNAFCAAPVILAFWVSVLGVVYVGVPYLMMMPA